MTALIDLQEDVAAEQLSTTALTQVFEAGQRFTPPAADVERWAELVISEVEAVLPLVLQPPTRARALWQRLLNCGWRGCAAEIQAAREPLRQNIEGKLALIQQVRRLAAMSRSLTGKPVSEEPALDQAASELAQFRDRVFGSWQCLEDLEELLAASYPLDAGTLQSRADQLPPPTTWHQENTKPF